MRGDEKYTTESITVIGVTFTADQVKSATVVIDGRDIHIGERDDTRPIGFGGQDSQ